MANQVGGTLANATNQAQAIQEQATANSIMTTAQASAKSEETKAMAQAAAAAISGYKTASQSLGQVAQR